MSSNVLNVTVKNLRDKLEAAGEPRVIHSIRAYGYVLKE
ncbi:MAG: winged helix-turn-helix domain-containing protein [Chloroflexi bacterium]|nr:winged helix-turn-helix domain-containing protein [Chloroflexota bacterium]